VRVERLSEMTVRAEPQIERQATQIVRTFGQRESSVLQTEFNVLLPWRRQADLPTPAEDSASLTIINAGSQVSCSVTVNGLQVQSNTGNGLTICTAVR